MLLREQIFMWFVWSHAWLFFGFLNDVTLLQKNKHHYKMLKILCSYLNPIIIPTFPLKFAAFSI